MGIENVFKPRIGNESLHQDINYNDVTIVNFATITNLVVKSTILCTETFISTPGPPLMERLNQIDHILIDRRGHSSILDVRSFRGADCDTDHCLVVANVRGNLAVSKQAAPLYDGERFNFRSLNELEFRKQYRIEISNSFAALDNLSDREDTNRAWENIKENIKT